MDDMMDALEEYGGKSEGEYDKKADKLADKFTEGLYDNIRRCGCCRYGNVFDMTDENMAVCRLLGEKLRAMGIRTSVRTSRLALDLGAGSIIDVNARFPARKAAARRRLASGPLMWARYAADRLFDRDGNASAREYADRIAADMQKGMYVHGSTANFTAFVLWDRNGMTDYELAAAEDAHRTLRKKLAKVAWLLSRRGFSSREKFEDVGPDTDLVRYGLETKFGKGGRRHGR